MVPLADVAEFALGRTGGGNGTNKFPSDPNAVPRRTFHRLTNRNGGISAVNAALDCIIIIGFEELTPPLPEDDGADEFEAVGAWLHSTAATIHPLEAATHLARGGMIGLVAEMFRSSSSMSFIK